jgi:predicted alpha/beta hydrolase
MVDEPYRQEFVELPAPYRLGLHIYPEPALDMPGQVPTAPVVVIFPALGTRARFYRPLAQALVAAGLAVVVVDLRGTGTSTPAPSRADRYGYRELAGDIGTVLTALKPRLDGRRYFLLGHSLGGQLATIHLANEPGEAAGLILVAVGLPHWRDYTSWSWLRRVAVLGITQVTAAVASLNRVSPGWAFGGTASRRLILDWAYTARHGRFPLPVDLSQLRTPVLAISVPRDRLTPGELLDHLTGMLTSAPVERVRLTEPLDHFSWVRSPDAVVGHVLRFVQVAVSQD